MLDRNQLVHAVIWPNGDDACVTLIDADGVYQSRFSVVQPLKGSDLARLIPPGYWLKFDGCTVLSMSGDVLVGGIAEFDSAVVTERREVTFEDRIAILERRDIRRQRQHDHEMNRLRQAQERAEAAPVVEEPQTAGGDSAEPKDPPQAQPEPQGVQPDGA